MDAEEGTMVGHTAAAKPPQDFGEVGNEAGVVHAWRVSQLARLGLSGPVAEAVADKVDWHEVAELVQRGCPAALAVAIVE
jgi:hypothetical protein